MKRSLFLLAAVLTLLAPHAVFASEVSNVELAYQEGQTLVRIEVAGAIRFTHQTEIAKDGKPFRVIVDVLSATHAIGDKNFSFLPDCPVKGIRTSQYAVSPENVVRLVFDMDADRVYRIDSDSKYITLYFADQSIKPFETWSTARTIAAKKEMAQVDQPAKETPAAVPSSPKTELSGKTTQELNAAINDDRLLSLNDSSKPADVIATTPVSKPVPEPKPAKPATKAENGSEFYGPEFDFNLPMPLSPLAESEAASRAQEASGGKAAVVTQPKAELSKPKVSAQSESVKPTESKPSATEEAFSSKAGDNPTVVIKPAGELEADEISKQAKQEPKEKPAVATEESKPDASDKAIAAEEEDSSENSESTARFRRSAADNKKIKGTMIAEFPQRLVIKYGSTAYRDPFATLIDETKTYDSPVDQRIANVEGLRLVGILESDGSDNSALFEDKEGYGYILKTGDKVRKGYVLRVENDRVYFQIFEYGWSRTVALSLES